MSKSKLPKVKWGKVKWGDVRIDGECQYQEGWVGEHLLLQLRCGSKISGWAYARADLLDVYEKGGLPNSHTLHYREWANVEEGITGLHRHNLLREAMKVLAEHKKILRKYARGL